MGVKKGTNNFQKMQKSKILHTKTKIKEAITQIGKNHVFLHLYELLKAVAHETGLSISTIRKNELYYDLCVKGFKKQMSKNCHDAIMEYDDYKQKYALLENENQKLKNQVIALTNALGKTPHLKEYVETQKTLEQVKVILKNVILNSENIVVIEDQIVCDNNKLNEKIICKNPVVKSIFATS